LLPLICLLLPALPGCLLSNRLPYKDDPLLARRTPAAGTSASARPALLALAEPVPPTLPAEAYVQRLPAHRPDTAIASAQPLPDTNYPERSNRLEVVMTSRRKVGGTYGHAADYTWLQGIIEFTTEGWVELRYATESDADAWGGIIRLDRDTRLSQLNPGDAVRVEGEMLLEPDPETRQLPLGPPAYRIHSLWLVSKSH
jgi:hypothetical protein